MHENTEGVAVVGAKVAELDWLVNVKLPEYLNGATTGFYQKVVLGAKSENDVAAKCEDDDITLAFWLGPKPVWQVRRSQCGCEEVVDDFWPVGN